MKIVSTGRTISTTEFLEKKQKSRRKLRVFVILSVSMLLVGLVALSRLESLRIRKISVSGAEVIGAQSVEERVREVLAGNFLWLIPHDNALLYRKGRIREELEKEFPRFSSVSLALDGLEQLQIGVVEREPYALYCLEETSECYFLDETGFIFDKAPTFSEGVYIVYSSDKAESEPLGRNFLPSHEFSALSRLVSNLPALGILPLRVRASSESFELHGAGGVEVLWLSGSDFERIFSNLESFLESPAIKAEKNFLNRVAKLDLRTEDKVFYSFQVHDPIILEPTQ